MKFIIKNYQGNICYQICISPMKKTSNYARIFISLFIVLYSLQIGHSFHNERNIISKMMNILVSLGLRKKLRY